MRQSALALVPAVALLLATGAAADVSKLQRITQELVAPPGAPAHEQVAAGAPRVVQVRLVIEEKRLQVAPDAEIWALTFGGSVPGPLIVVHRDDYVELTLVNPKTSTMLHNIDFHASTGALGGGELTQVAPGQEAVLRFKATRAGVFVYHCAPGGSMVPLHVVSGMNGAILVLPRDGLRDADGNPLRYDRLFYIGEQDYYIPRDAGGRFRRFPTPAAGFGPMLEVMRGLAPSHVVFNGQVGALTGDNALRAKTGEAVLFVHAQANRDTRPHLIGGHGDWVWPTGSFADPPQRNLETWLIAGGSAGAALYTFRQPGLYAYLNHNLIEAFLLGAVAHVRVEGEWNDDLMKQLKAPGPIESE